ncbi:porin family protein [Flavobacterium sp.]|uniref:porin family protein n=1 Tax=Flavobacterium sp. TaxID=239 RepID=UPI0032672A33
MKNFLLSFFTIAFFHNINYAQSKYNLGLVLGPNYTSFRGSDFLQSTKPDIGFLGGVFIQYQLNNTLSIISGLNFDQKEIENETDYPITYMDESTGIILHEVINAKTNNKFQYFSLSLVLKYNIGKNKSFYLNGGPYISFLQKHKKKSKFFNRDGGTIIYGSNYQYNFPLADNVSGDYGVSFGIGKTFGIDMKNKISIELRDNLGLKNTIEHIQIYDQSGVIKTNTLNLIANWSFNL